MSPHRGCCDDLLLLNPEGVYAWIGINFVLGRFDHADEGECECEGDIPEADVCFVFMTSLSSHVK